MNEHLALFLEPLIHGIEISITKVLNCEKKRIMMRQQKAARRYRGKEGCETADLVEVN